MYFSPLLNAFEVRLETVKLVCGPRIWLACWKLQLGQPHARLILKVRNHCRFLGILRSIIFQIIWILSRDPVPLRLYLHTELPSGVGRRKECRNQTFQTYCCLWERGFRMFFNAKMIRWFINRRIITFYKLCMRCVKFVIKSRDIVSLILIKFLAVLLKTKK